MTYFLAGFNVLEITTPTMQRIKPVKADTNAIFNLVNSDFALQSNSLQTYGINELSDSLQ